MPLDPSALSIAVVVLVLVGLAIWLAMLERSAAQLRGRLRRILSDNGTAGCCQTGHGISARTQNGTLVVSGNTAANNTARVLASATMTLNGGTLIYRGPDVARSIVRGLRGGSR